jgi:hypothetical protein
VLARPTVGNIFDTSFEENTFSIVAGIDAFCQMGDPASLFSKLFRWAGTGTSCAANGEAKSA